MWAYLKRLRNPLVSHAALQIVKDDGSILVYNLTYFLDQKMKCLVTQKFDLDPINIDLRNGKMSKILNLEWWASQFLGLKILTLIPLNQYIFSVFLQVWCSPVSKWWLKWT